ncbi:MAG: NAD-dependent malic enzyme [Gammaproteobacteria bacterium]|nr:NAD-dependent malic enzyme [Gammaproteobacteria bacterium]
MHHKQKKDAQGRVYYEVNQGDFDLVRNPILNKGSAFPENERHTFGLHGILPVSVSDLETQKQRSYKAFQNKATPLEKYIYLREVQDSNETLFYSLIVDHVPEMMPIVYTPVVGEACQNFSHIYRRPRGLYLTPGCKDSLDEILSHIRFDEVEAIVVSDGERILGLGDQGAGGMGIPIGKLALYTACAGIHPASTLPILLDTGTNNQDLLNDPLYMGWRHPRVRGQEYDDFIDLFVKAIQKRFPHVLLQWEDFAQQNANPILARYRNTLCTFNDDIQGTAAIATGTLLAAVQATHGSITDQHVVVVGGGSAGCGISSLMAQAMIDAGLSEAEAHSRFYIIDAQGLLTEDTANLLSFQLPFAQKKAAVKDWTLRQAGTISFFDVVKNAKPTVMLGVSGQPSLFTEEIVRIMASNTKQPVIFPLSNPTSRSEADPADIMKWTDGRAIVGTGSPFPDIMHQGKLRRVDQTNNAYIFPGMGLGIIAVKAKHVTDRMFMVAAKALAELSPAKNNPEANLLPPLDQIRAVSRKVAIDVALEAVKAGLTKGMTEAEVIAAIDAKMWNPDYLPYVKK